MCYLFIWKGDKNDKLRLVLPEILVFNQ
jgi:hypothetical protein